MFALREVSSLRCLGPDPVLPDIRSSKGSSEVELPHGYRTPEDGDLKNNARISGLIAITLMPIKVYIRYHKFSIRNVVMINVFMYKPFQKGHRF